MIFIFLSFLLKAYLFVVDEAKPDAADHDTHDLIPGQRFTAQEISDRQQRQRQKSALDDKASADGPSRLIGVDRAHIFTPGCLY